MRQWLMSNWLIGQNKNLEFSDIKKAGLTGFFYVTKVENYFSNNFALSGFPFHSSASGSGDCTSVITGHCLANSAFSWMNISCPSGNSSSAKIALAGHSGSHNVQSIHSSGSITKKLGPSWKQSTGHTSTQSVNLHLIQFSVTTKVIIITSQFYVKFDYKRGVSLAEFMVS